VVATVSMLIEGQWREGAKTYERAAILRKVAQLLLERADGIAEIMSRETGKAINDARAEVIRSQDTINGTSTWRTDQLAYGGIKASGIGR
jgi:acyl-CoA reductase-like NAD-dependent aldehyde dehydrogenase